MLKNILILLLGAVIGAAAYALISDMGHVDPGPSYETAISIEQARSLIRSSRATVEYGTLRTESNEQLKSLLLSKAALLNMMSHAKDNFAGIRLYPIFKSNGEIKGNNFSMVVVPFGKTASGFSDILMDNVMYDYLNPCPNACPTLGTALMD